MQNVTDPPTTKQFLKELKNTFDPTLFSQITLPEQDWAKLVYQLQFDGLALQSVSIKCIHMCQMDCRMVLEGS